MKKGIKTGAVVLLAGAVLSGCTSSREYALGMMFGTPRVEQGIEKPKTHFFVGRNFYDRDGDGHFSDGDGYYPSDSFKGKEPVLLIADVEGKGELTTRIWKRENGKLKLVEVEFKAIQKGEAVPYSFTAEELRNHPRGGAGNYVVEWEYRYGGWDNLIEKREFEIGW